MTATMGNGVVAMATFPDPIHPADQPFGPVYGQKGFFTKQ